MKYSASLKQARLNAVSAALSPYGSCVLYSGPQPASPDAPADHDDNMVLCQLTCAEVFADPVTSGSTLTANLISPSVGELAAGTEGKIATFARFINDQAVPVMDVPVVTSGQGLVISPSALIKHEQAVSVTSLTITHG